MRCCGSLGPQANEIGEIFYFLNEIGIGYSLIDESADSFLKGIKIVNGRLVINLKNLLCIGDILHEAGHLACLPESLRSKANGNIAESLGEEHTFEMGVIAWSVAAAIYLNIPLSHIFHKDGYNGDADWLVEQYDSGNYMGLPLLQWMGMVAYEDELMEGRILPYPKMLRWTRV